MGIRPETFCYLLRVIARPSCAFWRSRCPSWSQGCSARPPIAAGVWYKHLDGGFRVQGVRFGGLKSDQFHLLVTYYLLLLRRGRLRSSEQQPTGSGIDQLRDQGDKGGRTTGHPLGPRGSCVGVGLDVVQGVQLGLWTACFGGR
jgi:hypothetical protein